LVAPVSMAADLGYTGIKHMTRIDLADTHTAGALELLGQVLAEALALGVEALVEPLSWTNGAVDRTTAGIVYATVVAHDLGAALIKVPVPVDAEPGPARVAAVRRVVQSVGAPVLFLGGPRSGDRAALLGELADAMAGGGAGVAIGRAVYQDPDPAGMAALVAALVRGQRDLRDVTLAAGAFAGPGALASPPPPTGFRAVSLNHVTVRVPDLHRTSQFYQQFFGMPIRQQSATVHILSVGSSFFGIEQGTSQTPTVDHYDFGIAGFNADEARAKLKKRNLNFGSGTSKESFKFRDPDGFLVQLNGPDYEGHVS